jgi:hypothetical protein
LTEKPNTTPDLVEDEASSNKNASPEANDEKKKRSK